MEEWTQILLYFGKDLVRLPEEAGNQETCQQGLLASTAKSRLSISWNSSSDISGSSFQHFFKMDLYLYFKYHILIVLLLLILVLTADWAPCGDGCEGDTDEEQQEGDQEDQGEFLLQVGQPAGLATIFNFIHPVGRASSLSCSGHRGYKLCSLDDRSKPRMRLFPRAGWNCSTKRQQLWFFCSSGQN